MMIDPVLFRIGPLSVYWYGLMYMLGFIAISIIGRHRLSRYPDLTLAHWDLWISCAMLGVVIGGRLGYVCLYDPLHFWQHPHEIYRTWEGGMSFHGGLIGVLGVTLWMAKRHPPLTFWRLMDWVAPMVPLGLMLGRLGNWINGELWGRATSMPWGVVFDRIDGTLRHPYPIYAALGEGLFLWSILYRLDQKSRPTGCLSCAFLAGYGCIRFCLEYMREPDIQKGYLWLDATMGQWLSIPMIIIGLLGWKICARQHLKY